MKQKRQLIESLKEKESSQQQLMEECRGKMVRGGGGGREGRRQIMREDCSRVTIGRWGIGNVLQLLSLNVAGR